MGQQRRLEHHALARAEAKVGREAAARALRGAAAREGVVHRSMEDVFVEEARRCRKQAEAEGFIWPGQPPPPPPPPSQE